MTHLHPFNAKIGLLNALEFKTMEEVFLVVVVDGNSLNPGIVRVATIINKALKMNAKIQF